NLGTLLGGTVIVEQIFALPGMGQLMLQAINTRDATVVQGCVVVFAVVAVLANLAADLLYAVLDPRIRYDGRRGPTRARRLAGHPAGGAPGAQPGDRPAGRRDRARHRRGLPRPGRPAGPAAGRRERAGGLPRR